MKQLLIILPILIASVAYSQDTIQKTKEPDSILISVGQAKKAIRNAQLVPTLQSQIAIQDMMIAVKDTLIAKKNDKLQLEATKFNLLQNNYAVLNTQYTALKEVKKPKTWFRDTLIIVGVFSTGYLVGSQ